MKSEDTTQITHEALRLMDLQVEVLRGPLSELTVSQVYEYAERRDTPSAPVFTFPNTSTSSEGVYTNPFARRLSSGSMNYLADRYVLIYNCVEHLD